jgi:hypothetical protein
MTESTIEKAIKEFEACVVYREILRSRNGVPFADEPEVTLKVAQIEVDEAREELIAVIEDNRFLPR